MIIKRATKAPRPFAAAMSPTTTITLPRWPLHQRRHPQNPINPIRTGQAPPIIPATSAEIPCVTWYAFAPSCDRNPSTRSNRPATYVPIVATEHRETPRGALSIFGVCPTWENSGGEDGDGRGAWTRRGLNGGGTALDAKPGKPDRGCHSAQPSIQAGTDERNSPVRAFALTSSSEYGPCCCPSLWMKMFMS